MINVIIGPTASGKSALAVARAECDGGIIINADAMQCYDALPILTAQPDASDHARAPHRLYGTLDAAARMTAADWVHMAKQEIENALTQGRTPYLVGGTGLYIKALMEGLSPIPDIPEAVRASVRARIETEGLESVYADLAARDPVMAERLKAGDTQRILRAMEVLESTGKSLAYWQSIPLEGPPADWRFHVVQLRPAREQLEAKIRARLQVMLASGVMDEVSALSGRIDAGEVPADAFVTVAHGFRHFRAVMKGTMSAADAFEATAIETRQYTKRQRTWLRHQIRADEVVIP